MFFNNYEKANKFRMKLLADHAKGIVLDVGASQLPNKFFDYSEKIKEVWMLDVKEHKAELPTKYKKVILFDLDDLYNPLPLPDNTIDTIILGEILEHLYNPFRVLKECKRILKADGILLISTLTPKYYLELIHMLIFSKPMGFPEHKILFTRDQIKHMLNVLGFKIRKIIGYSFWIPLIRVGFVQTGFTLPELLTWHQIYIA